MQDPRVLSSKFHVSCRDSDNGGSLFVVFDMPYSGERGSKFRT
jgi:hypothetical protein